MIGYKITKIDVKERIFHGELLKVFSSDVYYFNVFGKISGKSPEPLNGSFINIIIVFALSGIRYPASGIIVIESKAK